MQRYLYLLLFALIFTACGETDTATEEAEEMPDDTEVVEAEEVTVHPIYHGSVVLTQGDRTIFIDPHGGAERYTSYGAPDLVLITHTHGDHMDSATLSGIDLSQAQLVGPKAVTDAIPSINFAKRNTLANGENWVWEDYDVAAVPAYNPPPKENFHPQGQFNGYVLTLDGERYYFSGDTEGVPEMRDLKEIDVAFVCMNLPYTMDVDQAVSAVLDFKPDVVYPYHYRNQDGTWSDVEAFRDQVNAGDASIEVRLEDWYGEEGEE